MKTQPTKAFFFRILFVKVEGKKKPTSGLNATSKNYVIVDGIIGAE